MRGKIDLKTLEKMVEKGDIQTIIVAGTDMQGRLLGKRYVPETFLKSFSDGICACSCNLGWDMDLILIPGLKFTGWHTGYQDMRVIPDFNTMRIYPWVEKTAIVLCDLCDEEGKPLEIAPRTILKRQVENARIMGFTPFMASELEFFLYKETIDAAREKDYRNLEPLSRYYSDYSVFRGTMDEWILAPIRNNLNDAGLEVESTKGEWGHGQVELSIRYTDALEMGDRHVILKNGVKEMAALQGLLATFIAKPSSADSGSGLHIHSSLWDSAGKKALFHDKKKPLGMSDTMRHYLGGMMQLAKDFQYFYAPYINSYKRYVAQSFAPYNITWGGDNRTVTFRICGHGSSCRIENRVPGADANGYLALAATLASGLYGIKHKLEPVGPFCQNDGYEAKKAPVFALTLSEAVENLNKSKIAREILGDEVVDHHVGIGRWEVQCFNTYVTDWERRKYFEFA